MFGFLNKFFLPFIAMVALPIIIHLLTRHKRVRIQFSSLRFLHKIQQQKMKKFRLRQIILLVLRTLIVFFLIASFARPTIKGFAPSEGSSHEPTTAILLLDKSYSMSANSEGVSVLTRAKESATEIISLLQNGDFVNIIPFNSKANVSFNKPTQIIEDIPQVLDTISFSYESSSLENALNKAFEEIEKSMTIQNEIYLLTDNNGNIFEKADKINLPKNTHLFVFPFDYSPDPNTGISEIEFPGKLLEIGHPVEISAVVENFSDIALGDIPVSLHINNERVAQTGIELASGESQRVPLSTDINTGGIHYGYFETPGDLISVDNKRYFTFRIPDGLKVLIIGDKEETKFLDFALKAGTESYFTSKLVSNNQLHNEYLNDFDVVIIDRLKQLPQGFEGRLMRFVNEGGGLWILGVDSEFTENKSLRNFTNNIAGVMPEMISGTDRFESGANQKYYEPGKFNREHPVFSVFEDGKLPPVKFFQTVKAEMRGNIIMSYSNGYPAMLDVSYGDGKVLFSSFSIDYSGTDILTGGFFVPLVHRSTQYLAGQIASFDEDYVIGNDVLRAIENVPDGSRLIIEAPSGNRTYATPRFNLGKAMITVPEVSEPGIWNVYADSVIVDAFAVNVITDESRVVTINKDKFNSRFDTNPPIWVDATQMSLSDSILQAKYGRELRTLFLWIAILLMILELIIETTWRREKTQNISGDF